MIRRPPISTRTDPLVPDTTLFRSTFGAFLTSEAAAGQALDLAYRDVLTAFDQFVTEIGPDRPIILAGHSQGALHLTRLLKDRVAGTPLATRLVAAYVVRWPVSQPRALPAPGPPEPEEPPGGEG